MCCSVLGGCTTCLVWESQRDGELVSLPDNRRSGAPPPRIEAEFANDVVGLVLTPFALVADVLLFPVQLMAGYRPYGERRW